MWAWTILVSLKILIVQNKTEYHLVGNCLVFFSVKAAFISFLKKEKKFKGGGWRVLLCYSENKQFGNNC